jgi:hypothetical protein
MKKIFVLIFCLLPLMLLAQSAMDYFHTAANFYVNANKKSAQKTIKEGIQKFPNDPTLKNLSSKIEELPENEDEPNQQKQQNQDNNDDQNKDQQQQNKQDKKDKQEQQQDKRQLDALQQNERQPQQKVAEEEMKKGGKAKQEKDW